ncbi:hypothetical protein FALBO_3708 [Fusarium albosuccineum]|uniref:Uncharacterized protein n=1 Tax=Fusarium albosuccineum TaxID=1237068 RepID=A0A8H4LGU1_9HYPO|nr:hypothetical protein FALBO_3708 [Fusarium albosuccineum]
MQYRVLLATVMVLVTKSLATPVVEPRQADLPVEPLLPSESFPWFNYARSSNRNLGTSLIPTISTSTPATGTPTPVTGSVLPAPTGAQASPLEALQQLIDLLTSLTGGLARRSAADLATYDLAHKLLDEFFQSNGGLPGPRGPGGPGGLGGLGVPDNFGKRQQ